MVSNGQIPREPPCAVPSGADPKSEQTHPPCHCLASCRLRHGPILQSEIDHSILQRSKVCLSKSLAPRKLLVRLAALRSSRVSRSRVQPPFARVTPILCLPA